MKGNNIENSLGLICDKEEIIQEIVQATKFYFYDTSSFRNHASVYCRKLILQYIANTRGIVILTRSVFMELCMKDGTLWKEHALYIHEMNEMGIKVLCIHEENIVELLQSCYNNISQINTWLSYAVKCVKSKYGAIETALAQDETLKQEVLVNYMCQDRLLGRRFFDGMRARKEMGDNLGEELLCVCLHMLTNIPELVPYKYVMLTDDKNAVRLLGQVKQNVARNLTQKYLTAHTSANLCWHMKKSGIDIHKEEVLAFLQGEKESERITTYCSDRYALFPEMQSMTCEEMADKIIREDIVIYM